VLKYARIVNEKCQGVPDKWAPQPIRQQTKTTYLAVLGPKIFKSYKKEIQTDPNQMGPLRMGLCLQTGIVAGPEKKNSKQ